MSRRTLARQPSYRSDTVEGVRPGVLPIDDPGMIGRASFDVQADHARTDQSAGYSYAPASPTDPTRLRLPLGAPRTRIGTRNPWTLRPYVQPPTNPGIPVQTTNGPGGSPAYDVMAVDQHSGPTEQDLVNIGVADSLTWWERLFRLTPKPARNAQGVGVVVTDRGTKSQPSMAASGQTAFTMPDYRRTFDTPAAPGIPLDYHGNPTVAKAGVPLPDPADSSARETVHTGYVGIPKDVNFPDMGVEPRVAAGPALFSQARPAVMPSGFYQFHRQFDANSAQHLSGQKGVMPSPTAGQPLRTTQEQVQSPDAIAGAFGGFVGGSAAPGMMPIGTSPNTVRQVPQSWDYDLNLPVGGGTVGRTNRRSMRRG